MKHGRSLTLRTRAWEGDREETLFLPEGFRIHECRMAGHGLPELEPHTIREKVLQPVHGPRLQELARGCRRVCVVFDDLTRPTPVSLVLPFILEELSAAGIPKENVSLVSGLAAHPPMNRRELALKLGSDVLASYPVYNHNMYENCPEVGHTSLGMALKINREVAEADLVVGVGAVLPYWWKGVFSGGGKIILPGVAARESILEHHRLLSMARRGERDLTMQRVWAHMAEAAELAGMHFLIDILPSPSRRIIDLFAGQPSAVYNAASAMASRIYRTMPAAESDIVLINSYPQELQIAKSFRGAHASLRQGGTAVIVARHPEGLSHVHNLVGRFGTDFGGPNWNASFALRMGKASNVIFYVGRRVRLDIMEMSPAEGLRVWFEESWDEVMTKLLAWHGKEASMAVYPYAALQEII